MLEIIEMEAITQCVWLNSCRQVSFWSRKTNECNLMSYFEILKLKNSFKKRLTLKLLCTIYQINV